MPGNIITARTQIFYATGNCQAGVTNFDFGPAAISADFELVIYGLTWSSPLGGGVTGAVRDVFELIGRLGGFTTTIAQYNLTQGSFANLQNSNGFARLGAGLLGRFRSTVVTAPVPTFNVQVAYGVQAVT